MSDSPFDRDAAERLLSAYIDLKSRLDAMNAILMVLARHAGIEPRKLRTTLRTLTETISHKYRERIEDRSSGLAARLDELAGTPDVDLTLLDQLRFDDQHDTEA